MEKRGLKPKDVTDVLLTHSHHDHSVNWTLFRHARIVIGNTELNWSLGEPWGETPRIASVLDAALDKADAKETGVIGREFVRHRITSDKAINNVSRRAR